MGWAERAACRGVSIDVFYPDIPIGDQRTFYWHKARTFCKSCPVVAECLAFVEPFEKASGRRDGMWGGLTPGQRAERGRPVTPVRIR